MLCRMEWGELGDTLPINKTVLPKGDITSIIRHEWRLDERPLANAADNLLQYLQTHIPDLVIGYCPWIKLVVVCHDPSAAMARFHQ